MNNSSVTEIKQNIIEKEYVNFCWKGSLPIQYLLDAISSILAEEYIMIAKQNPEVFLNNTPRLSELRGCAPSGQGANK
jgi:hypothetical protein